MADIIRRRSRSVVALPVRAALSVLSFPYAGVVRLRNFLYDRKLLPQKRLPRPVVSIGNLSVGGTGKTPVCIALARWLASEEVRCVVLSRGYGARAGELNDEGKLFTKNVGTIPLVQDANRFGAASAYLQHADAQLFLLDDGFQHRGLARDLDIVLVDAAEPFPDHVTPAGLFREPAASLRRADLVLITKAGQVDATRLETLKRDVARFVPPDHILTARYRAEGLVSLDGKTVKNPEALDGLPVAAFCGIGAPDSFKVILERLGLEIRKFTEFADHHPYTAKDARRLVGGSLAKGAGCLVTTEKDAVKLEGLPFEHTFYVKLGLDIENVGVLQSGIKALLA